jgi:hypothetical protein
MKLSPNPIDFSPCSFITGEKRCQNTKKMGTFPKGTQKKAEKGDRPLFLGLSLLVNVSKKNWDCPPSLKKGACPLFI